MKRKFQSIPVIVLLVVALLVLSSGVQAQTIEVQEPSGSLVTATAISEAEQKAALDFWTREAISEAQPMVMPVEFGPAEIDKAALVEQTVSEAPGFSPAGRAAPNADREAQAAYPLDWAGLKESFDAADLSEADLFGPEGTSQIYTSYIVNQFAALQPIYPHKYVGRLSFRVPGGTSYCSATSISGNVMLTAAHCLYDTTNNRWYSNWVFTPAYRNGNAPYGSFAATNCAVLTAWVNLSGNYSINNWARHDVGVCRMGRNSANQTLNGAVGFMGREWNQPFARHVHNLGYPFKNYNNATLTDAGKWLRTCIAETFQQATETRGMGCNHGGGISGGPWTRGYAVNVVSGWATGVNSGIYIGTQNIYAGRFNSNNIVPLCTWAPC